MKKIMITCLITLLSAMQVFAEDDYDFVVDGFYYKYDLNTMTATIVHPPYAEGIEYKGAITIPATVKNGRFEFEVTEIDKNTFANFNITSVTFKTSNGKGVKKIGSDAFAYCYKLERVDLPNTLTRIGERAFLNCQVLKTIKIPSGVTKIERLAFNGCKALESVVLPETMESMAIGEFAIGEYAFSGCGLTSVTLPKGLIATSPYAFSGCKKLTTVNFPNDFQAINTGMFQNCTSLSNISFPDSLKGILRFSFDYCPLTSVTIPSGLEVLMLNAFYECQSLEEIILEDGEKPLEVGDADEYEGREYSALKKLYWGRNVIKQYERDDFTTENLTSITIGKYVTEIPYTFSENLKEIICKNRDPYSVTEKFSKKVKGTAVLKVPAGTYDKYCNAPGWKEFFNIEEMEGDDDDPALKDMEIRYEGVNRTYQDEVPSIRPTGYIAVRPSDFENNICNHFGINRTTFKKHFEDFVRDRQQNFQQYAKDTNGNYVVRNQADYIGNFIVECNEVDGNCTIGWKITDYDVQKLYSGWNRSTEKTYVLSTIIKMVDGHGSHSHYGDVYLEFTTKVTFKPYSVTEIKVKVDWNNAKKNQYWYANNSSDRGLSELHVTVPTFEDNLRNDADELTCLFSNAFVNNEVVNNNIVTGGSGFNYNNYKYRLVFDTSNNGKKFKGADGKTYSLKVSEDGRTLSANNQAIAKLVLPAKFADKANDKEEANYTMIEYQHSTAAHALLNYCSYSEFNNKNEAVLKDFLNVIVTLNIQNDDVSKPLLVEEQTFNVRFIRPVDITVSSGNDGDYTVNLNGLFKDWRNVWKSNYFAYYGIRSIKVPSLADGDDLSTNRSVKANLNNTGMKPLYTLNTPFSFTYREGSSNGTYIQFYDRSDNTDNIQSLILEIPVTVQYIWGDYTTLVSVTIVEDSNTGEYYPINFGKDQKVTRIDRSVSFVSLGDQRINLNVDGENTLVYHDLTNQTITLTAGKTVTPTIGFRGMWMHGFLYIDLNNDGQFSVQNRLHQTAWSEESNGELISYKNEGNALNWNSQTLPDITLPTKAGRYRARFKVDWNSTDPGGNTGSDPDDIYSSNHIVANGGFIIDVMIDIISNASGIEDTNSVDIVDQETDSWYTIDGVKLNGEPKKKGIYIRNGKKVVK